VKWENELLELNIKDRHGNLIKQNGVYICPNCSHTRSDSNKKTPCLSVTFVSDGVVYKCHHCGIFKGKVFYDTNVVKQHYNDYKKEYIKPTLKDTDITPIDKKEILYKYFEKRKISRSVVDKYKIECNSNKEILFPYYWNNEIVSIKYKKPTKDGKSKYRISPNSKKIFYGMDQIPVGTRELTITEGEIEPLSYAQIGIPAVSIPIGGVETKLECIENCWEWLEQFDKFIIATDNDEIGRKIKNNLLLRLPQGKTKCKVVDWGFIDYLTSPDKYKDANELLCYDETGKALKELHESSKFLPTDGIVTMSEIKDSIMDYYESGYGEGFLTGWDSVDKWLTIKPQYVMVLTGHPSRGKSFFMDNLLFNLIKQHGHKSLICSFETTSKHHFSSFAEMYKEKKFAPCISRLKIKDISLKDNDNLYFSLFDDGYINKNCVITEKFMLIKNLCDFNISNEFIGRKVGIFNYLKKVCENSMTKDDVLKSIDYFNDYIYMLDTEKTWSVTEILEKAEIQIKKYGINNLVIDPYNMLETPTDKEHKHIENMLTELRNFAKKHNIFVAIVVHPSKMPNAQIKVDNENKEILKIPHIKDASGSHAWWSKADYGICIHREREVIDKGIAPLSKITQMLVNKLKNKSLGKATDGVVVNLKYNEKTYKLEDIKDEF